MISDPGSTSQKPDYKLRIKKSPMRRWVSGGRFKDKISLVSILLCAVGFLFCLHLVLERSRHPETSKEKLAGNSGLEVVTGKKAEPFPVGSREPESPVSRTLNLPQIDVLPKNTEDKMEGGAPEKVISDVNREMKVIGNRDSRRYHLPGMKYYDKVQAYHRVEFESEEAAVRAGYQKAKE